MGKLDGKVALITGAGRYRGIGEAGARRFIEEGARVVITDVLEDEGREKAKELGDNCLFLQQDVSKDEDWTRVVADAVEHFGRLDILVNNAGIVQIGTIEQEDFEVWQKVIGVNLIGAAIGHRHVLPHMETAGGGSIINVSSTEGMDAANGLGAYAASKWGLRGFTKIAAIELGRRGIRVNSIHPGAIDTKVSNPMDTDPDIMKPVFSYFPLARMGSTAEVSDLMLFLASDESSFITGAEIAIDGGSAAGRFMKMLPGAPDDLF
ncbi:MAG: glucose 1-dehydrogenase [Pseudomonadota bacterium]